MKTIQEEKPKTSIQKAQEARRYASYENVGRHTKMTDEVIKKLEEVFAIGGTDAEACFYANIAPQTLYNYQESHPEFVERKEALKERPILKARQTLVKTLDDPKNAQWYLERKRRSEFGGNALPDTPTGNTTYNFLFNPQAMEEVRQIEAKIKSFLIGGANDKEAKEVVEAV